MIYSSQEVSKNNGRNGNKFWLVYKDSVYDVTGFVHEHPGGAELITEWAGKDCTKAFDDFGHSGDAKNQMKKYKIGELAEEDRVKKGGKKEQKTDVKQNGDATDLSKQRSCINIITCGLIG